MRLTVIMAGAVLAALAAAGCNKADSSANNAPQTKEAKKAAGNETIASGLGDSKKFAEAAKASGLEATLAGPGPYTVLVPSDAAFEKMPAGALDTLMKPE